MNELFFETIKCDDFEIYNLLYHKKRIAKTIKCNLNLEEYIYPTNEQLLKCKLIYDKNGIIDIEYSPYEKKTICSFKLIFDDTITYDAKKLDRKSIHNLYEQKEENDEIIIVKDGFITDTSIANIAIWYEERWFTPKTPLLMGTTRERYLDNGFLSEANITVEMLKKSTKIALLNAMIDFDIIRNFRIKGIV
ncbi:MAG: aminotransferase class IV [Arcobacteraceae bacterium]|jgi:4-amino-4-deoxychorismate lyase|nr:aminotransferase class IV [Arcobacteraceae bacterium]